MPFAAKCPPAGATFRQRTRPRILLMCSVKIWSIFIVFGVPGGLLLMYKLFDFFVGFESGRLLHMGYLRTMGLQDLNGILDVIGVDRQSLICSCLRFHVYCLSLILSSVLFGLRRELQVYLGGTGLNQTLMPLCDATCARARMCRCWSLLAMAQHCRPLACRCPP